MRRSTRASGRGSVAAPPASRSQHITGRAYFRYLELEVGPGVFVPRPETEVMTGWAIDRLREMDVAEPVVVDLGTGSGAIALAIAQEVPRARVHAVEADPIARGWTEKNVARVASAAPYTRGRVTLHSADFTGADFTGLTSPGLTSTGLTSTGLASTGLASPGLASTGLASTGLTSPGLTSRGPASPPPAPSVSWPARPIW